MGGGPTQHAGSGSREKRMKHLGSMHRRKRERRGLSSWDIMSRGRGRREPSTGRSVQRRWRRPAGRAAGGTEQLGERGRHEEQKIDHVINLYLKKAEAHEGES